MVSNARLDLPEPLRPVITTRLSRGRVTSTFLRLCSRAPRIVIWLVVIAPRGADGVSREDGETIARRAVRGDSDGPEVFPRFVWVLWIVLRLLTGAARP